MAASGERPFAWKLGVYSFQLVPRELLGSEPHTIEPIPFLAAQISSTAELTYADISREVEVAFAQDNFVGGHSDNLRFALERNTKFRYSRGLDTSYPGFVFCGPKVATIGATIAQKPTKGAQRGNVTYVAAGTLLYQVTDSATRTLDTTFANAITDLLVWGGNLIVATGDANDVQYRASDASGGAFTTLAGIKGKLLAAVGAQLWRAITNTSSIFSADAIAGTWTQYDVGNSSYDITGLAALDGNVLLVYKQDGAYAFDEDLNAIALTPELVLQADAQVGKAGAVFNRDAYFSSRIGIVQIVRGGGLKSVGLERLADSGLPGTPPETRPTAFTSDGRFLYALVVPSAVNGIYVYKLDFAGAWHNYLWRSDLGASSDLLLATGKLGSTVVNAILFAYQSGGNWQLAYGRFASTADPTQDSNYQFDTDNLGILRSLDGVSSYPTIAKYADRVKIIADSLTGVRTIVVNAYADNNPSRPLGTYSKSPNDDRPITPLTHHRVSVELQMKSNDVAQTQRLRAFHLSVVLTPPVVRRHTCVFLAEARTPLETGGRSIGTAGAVVDRLRELQAKRISLDCVDEDGRPFKAYLADIAERTLWRKAAAGWESAKAVTAVLKEIGEQS